MCIVILIYECYREPAQADFAVLCFFLSGSTYIVGLCVCVYCFPVKYVYLITCISFEIFMEHIVILMTGK